MEKKEVTIINSITVAGVTIIPVSKVTINYGHSQRGIAFYGSAEPDSIIIVTPSAKRAFRITGEEVTFDQLARETPDIRKTLEEIQSGSY